MAGCSAGFPLNLLQNLICSPLHHHHRIEATVASHLGYCNFSSLAPGLPLCASRVLSHVQPEGFCQCRSDHLSSALNPPIAPISLRVEAKSFQGLTESDPGCLSDLVSLPPVPCSLGSSHSNLLIAPHVLWDSCCLRTFAHAISSAPKALPLCHHEVLSHTSFRSFFFFFILKLIYLFGCVGP